MNKSLMRLPDLFVDRLFGHSLFDGVLNEFDLAVQESVRTNQKIPKVNFGEDDDFYHIQISISGYDKSEVKLELKNNHLYISAQNKNVKDDKQFKWHYKEIALRAFNRVIYFPILIDPDSVKCDYKDGLISLEIRKMIKKDNTKLIEIKD